MEDDPTARAPETLGPESSDFDRVGLVSRPEPALNYCLSEPPAIGKSFVLRALDRRELESPAAAAAAALNAFNSPALERSPYDVLHDIHAYPNYIAIRPTVLSAIRDKIMFDSDLSAEEIQLMLQELKKK